MSTERKLMQDTEAVGAVAAPDDRAEVGVGVRDEGGGERPDPSPARDYFTDPAPLLRGRESREREERMRRLERGRPRRRGPRVGVGLLLVPVVVLAAGALAVLGRSGHHGSSVGERSGTVRQPVREKPVRSGPAAAIGPARVIATAPARHSRKAGDRRHHGGAVKPPVNPVEDETSTPVETPAPEATVTGSAEETSTGSEASQSTSTSTEESSGSKASSSTEADAQFGFAR